MEIWKPIDGFKNYKISSYGNLKSLNYRHTGKEKLRKLSIDKDGYYKVNLSSNGVKKIKRVHKLVAIAFLGHVPCGFNLVVNHKDFNKLNNHVDNLEIVTSRQNSNRKHLKSSSVYTGVCWDKSKNKWMSSIYIKGKNKHLGYFINEYDAHLAYEKHLQDFLLEK